MRPLQNLDAAFLALENPSWRLHVGAVIVLEPPPGRPTEARYEEIRTLISRRLVQVPAFRQRALRVAFGLQHPVWVDDPEFDLADHVSRVTLPGPGEDTELAAVVAEVLSRPLDLARPLWEMVVVEGLTGGRTAVIAKLHHAILDGVSAALLLGSFLDLAPDADFGPVPEPWDPPPLPSPVELCGQGAVSLVRQPGIAVSALRRVLDVAVELSTRNRELARLGEKPPPSLFSGPRTSLNGSISSRRSYAGVVLPVEKIKQVRRSFGVTFNDVVVAAVSGGLRSLLDQRAETPDRSLVALVPISIRSESEHGSFGNRISAMLVSLATDEGDPVERLQAVAKSGAAAKAQEELLSGSLLGEIAQLTVPVLATIAARCLEEVRLFDRVPPPFNLTLSNIPGPTFDLWWAGGRVAALHPIGPIADGVSLNITAMSYLDSLYLGLLGCRRLIPDMEALGEGIVQSLDQLVKLGDESSGIEGYGATATAG
jgi:diacylglycerol O-acyltransferase / wax synthase